MNQPFPRGSRFMSHQSCTNPGRTFLSPRGNPPQPWSMSEAGMGHRWRFGMNRWQDMPSSLWRSGLSCAGKTPLLLPRSAFRQEDRQLLAVIRSIFFRLLGSKCYSGFSSLVYANSTGPSQLPSRCRGMRKTAYVPASTIGQPW